MLRILGGGFLGEVRILCEGFQGGVRILWGAFKRYEYFGWLSRAAPYRPAFSSMAGALLDTGAVGSSVAYHVATTF